jgi:hypothetical protein
LTKEELVARVTVATEAANTLGDFYAGLEIALVSILISPDFLFRVEEAEPDPVDHAPHERLDGLPPQLSLVEHHS